MKNNTKFPTGKQHISFSEIKIWKECPYRHKLLYIDKVGEYEVLCAEYCGVGHYAMRGGVIVQSEQDYENWLQGQQTFSELIAKQKKIELNETKLVKK